MTVHLTVFFKVSIVDEYLKADRAHHRHSTSVDRLMALEVVQSLELFPALLTFMSTFKVSMAMCFHVTLKSKFFPA